MTWLMTHNFFLLWQSSSLLYSSGYKRQHFFVQWFLQFLCETLPQTAKRTGGPFVQKSVIFWEGSVRGETLANNLGLAWCHDVRMICNIALLIPDVTISRCHIALLISDVTISRCHIALLISVLQALADQCKFRHDCSDCRRVNRFRVKALNV